MLAQRAEDCRQKVIFLVMDSLIDGAIQGGRYLSIWCSGRESIGADAPQIRFRLIEQTSYELVTSDV